MNTYTISDFIDCDECLTDKIKTYYVPVSEKIRYFNAVIDRSVETNTSGKQYLNHIKLRVNFLMAIMDMYTTFEVDFEANDFERHMACYDMLTEYNIAGDIMDIIEAGNDEIQYEYESHTSNNEMAECRTICDCLLETYREKELNRESATNDMLESFSSILKNVANLR